MNKYTLTIQRHLEAYGPLNEAVEAAQTEAGGRLTVLSRTLHGDNAVAHVCYWHHDPQGRFIVDENWNIVVPFPYTDTVLGLPNLTEDELHKLYCEVDQALSHMGEKSDEDYILRDILSEEMRLRRFHRVS